MKTIKVSLFILTVCYNLSSSKYHFTPLSLSDDRQYIQLLRIIQDLYRLGFRVISQEVNMVVGADKNGIYNHLEIVFMKEN